MQLFEGKVYMITSKETEKIYIGSTIQTLKARFRRHKGDMKRDRNCSSKEIVKYPDADIYLLDRMYVTKSRADFELLKLEGKYQLINKDICVNELISRGMTHKEHDIFRCIDPEKRNCNKVRCKIYRDSNKEHMKQANHFNRTSFFGQLCKMYKIYN